jgi:hypothetical protein
MMAGKGAGWALVLYFDCESAADGLTEFARNTHKNLQRIYYCSVLLSGSKVDKLRSQEVRRALGRVKGNFLDHLEEVNKKLASVGRPALGVKSK